MIYRHQLLPDHSSLELDLEEELMSPCVGVEDMTASPFCSAPMTISIDSAIHSGTGSRSTSSSPVPLGMGHSFLRYASRQPSPQVHVLDSPCEPHPQWKLRPKSTPRVGESEPHLSGVSVTGQACPVAGRVWPSGQPRVHRTKAVVEEQPINDDSPSFDSALELSDRLVDSFSELWSPL